MKTMKEWREERGVTQLEMAFGIGVTPATIANWESGRREPKARHLRALANFLDVPMDEIDFGELDVKRAA